MDHAAAVERYSATYHQVKSALGRWSRRLHGSATAPPIRFHPNRTDSARIGPAAAALQRPVARSTGTAGGCSRHSRQPFAPGPLRVGSNGGVRRTSIALSGLQLHAGTVDPPPACVHAVRDIQATRLTDRPIEPTHARTPQTNSKSGHHRSGRPVFNSVIEEYRRSVSARGQECPVPLERPRGVGLAD